MKTYEKIAQTCQARLSCIESMNSQWEVIHEDAIDEIVKNSFPSGSGFDSGTKFDFQKSTGQKLVFNTSYHFMDENGFYSGWEDYKIVVTPSLSFRFDVKIIGKNKNSIKDYMSDVFWEALNNPI